MTVSSFWDRERLLRSTILAGFAAAGLTVTPAFAQDAVDETQEAEEEEDDGDTIIVTGSRIQRSEFTSISPVQIISGEQAREVGLVNAAEVLQSQSQAAGFQIDETFTGFVLDNGPGSSQVNLRGLDASRTLVLVNGRRMSPAGIGGAPSSPDLTVIPGIIVERFDLLLDGASSIYGSDAVAGVANVILRTDFEGVEFEYRREAPTGQDGVQTTYAGAWGVTSDRGYAGFGFEYNHREATPVGDISFCETFARVDENGQIYTADQDVLPGMGADFTECRLSLINRMSIAGYGSVYWTPGQTNINIPGWSESSLGGVVVDGNGDGLADFDFYDPFYNYNASDRARQSDWIPEQERYSLFSYGEHDIDWGSNTSVFYELLVANRQSIIRSDPFFVATDVPASNPFNPCNNVSNPNGVNCFTGFGIPDALAPIFSDNFPIVRVNGHLDRNDTELQQTRFVTGFRGDLPLFNNWTYELFGSYARSQGFQRIYGVNEDRLQTSLYNTEYDPVTGTYSCTDPQPAVLDCVPVNLFAANLYQEGGGYFTPEEADYLLTQATNRTVVEQTMIGGIFSGTLMQLANGSDVPLILGFEWREDALNSQADDVRANGNLHRRNTDRGAAGRRHLWEAFFETELSPIRGRRFVEELTFNLSGRYTDENNYGSDFTYSVKGVYRPNDWMTFRGSYGTSYRAPNAREQFLAGASGFNTISDPCVVPVNARQSDGNPNTPDTYDPSGETRSSIVIANCQAAGVNPFALGLDPDRQPSYGIEIITGGTTALNAETSTSQTFGTVIEQPWFDAFDLRFAVTYYDIVVTDSIAEPGQTFIINDCYADQPNFSSGFCNRITRDGDGFIDLVNSSFINIGTITSKGVDFNLVFQDDISFLGDWGFTLDVRATRANEQIFNVLGTVDDNAGETDVPHWVGNVRATLDRNDWRFSWFTRYVGAGEENEPALGADDTCPGTVCRPIWYTDDYYVHTASVSWTPNDWTINVGIENLFDEDPPYVDANGVFSVFNRPLGVGHDQMGRRWFIGVRKEF